MASSLKDIRSQNLTSLKVDGYTRTIPGTFASSGGDITGLPVGHGILINDRVEITYSAPPLENGLVGVTNATGFEANLGVLRVDKTLSSFATVGALQAAFTPGLVLSFQNDILTGATVQVKTSSAFGGAAALDGALAGDPGFWYIAINLSTATGFPVISNYPTFSAFSPDIPIYQGVGATTLTDLVVSALPTTTSVTIRQGIVNIPSFTDILVRKHSRIKDATVIDHLEIDGEVVKSETLLLPSTNAVSSLKMLWAGLDSSGNVITGDTPELGIQTPADPFGVGGSINLINVMSHPYHKEIGVILYQDIGSSNFYLQGFKYTYDGGFVTTFTPFQIVGPDSLDMRAVFSSEIDTNHEILDTALIFVFGGKATPGTAIYAGSFSIDPVTLAISDTGLFPWADTGLVTSSGDFINLIKVVDLRVLGSGSPVDRRALIIFQGSTSLASIGYNTGSNTFYLAWDYVSAFASENYDYHGSSSSNALCVTGTDMIAINAADGTSYPISNNLGSRYKKLYDGSDAGDLTLYKVKVYEGIGGETISLASLSNDPSSRPRSNVNYESIPANFQDSPDRGQGIFFDIGTDRVLCWSSYHFYQIINKHTGQLIHLGKSLGIFPELQKSDHTTAVLLNGDTLLYYKSGNWHANKFLPNGPFLAYGNFEKNALIANPGGKIKTAFNLQKGSVYYYSYFNEPIAIYPRISTVPGYAAKRVGVAIDTNTLAVDMAFGQSPSTVKLTSTALTINNSAILGGAANRVLFESSGNLVTEDSQFNYDPATSLLSAPKVNALQGLTVNGNLFYTATGDLTFTSPLNNGVLGVSSLIRANVSSAVITGIVSTPGQEFMFINAWDTRFTHNDASSSASNRFYLPGGVDFVLPANTPITFIHLQPPSGVPGWRVKAYVPVAVATSGIPYILECIQNIEIDLTTAASGFDTVAIPNGYYFYLERFSVFIKALAGSLLTQPTISLGPVSNSTLFINGVTTTSLTSGGQRQVWDFSNTATSETPVLNEAIRFTINTGATGTGLGMSARYYVQGFLVKTAP